MNKFSFFLKNIIKFNTIKHLFIIKIEIKRKEGMKINYQDMVCLLERLF
jgi:hypothetical protein